MKKEILEKKSWYRFLKVIFYSFVTIGILITFFIAKEEVKTQVFDEEKTYETIGAKVKETNVSWDGWKYPSIEVSTNQEIGKAFYENRYDDPTFYQIWSTKKGTYEFYKDKYLPLEKFWIYLKYFGELAIIVILLRSVGNYIFLGKQISH